MVVDQIHIEDVTFLEPEDHPPIPAHGHRPEARQIALEPVQMKTGQIDIPRQLGGVENG